MGPEGVVADSKANTFYQERALAFFETLRMESENRASRLTKTELQAKLARTRTNAKTSKRGQQKNSNPKPHAASPKRHAKLRERCLQCGGRSWKCGMDCVTE